MNNARILVVDDDPKLTSLVRILLERLGSYAVREENCSLSALTAAREYRPDLVILDVNMPDKDGGDVAMELADDPQLACVPVMFLSSLVAPGEGGLRGGALFISKPVEPRLLLSAVRGYLPAEVSEANSPALDPRQ